MFEEEILASSSDEQIALLRSSFQQKQIAEFALNITAATKFREQGMLSAAFDEACSIGTRDEISDQARYWLDKGLDQFVLARDEAQMEYDYLEEILRRSPYPDVLNMAWRSIDIKIDRLEQPVRQNLHALLYAFDRGQRGKTGNGHSAALPAEAANDDLPLYKHTQSLVDFNLFNDPTYRGSLLNVSGREMLQRLNLRSGFKKESASCELIAFQRRPGI